MHYPGRFIKGKVGVGQMILHILPDHLISGVVYRVLFHHALFHQTDCFQAEGLQVAVKACKAFRFQQFNLGRQLTLAFLSEQFQQHGIQFVDSCKISFLVQKTGIKIIQQD